MYSDGMSCSRTQPPLAKNPTKKLTLSCRPLPGISVAPLELLIDAVARSSEPPAMRYVFIEQNRWNAAIWRR